MKSITESRSGPNFLRPEYHFAGCILDTDRGLLRCRDGEAALRPKSFEVLSHLVENAGRLVSKDELLQAVWPDVVVTEDSLTQCLVDIRKALGDPARQLLRTVPRRGYILEAQVTRVDNPESAGGRPGARGNRRRPILAVIAFLIVAATSLWLPRFGTEPANPFGTGTAAAVSASPQLGPGELADDPQADRAREHFQKGQFFFNRLSLGDLELAHENFLRAIELDPSRAAYWVGHASTIGLLALRGEIGWGEGLELRKQALDRALTLDPLSAEAYVRLAQLQFQTFNHELTAAYLEQALELGRDNPLVLSIAADIAFVERRFDEAVTLQRRAVELDPIGFVRRGNLATYLFTAGYLEEAAREFINASELNPAHGDAFALQIIKIRILQKRLDEAEKVLEDIPPGAMRDQGLAYVHHTRGEEEAAQAALENFLRDHKMHHAGQLSDLHAYIGRVEESFHWLAQATEIVFDNGDAPANQFMLLMLQKSPFLHPLHDDPRWEDWLQDTRRRIEESRT